MCVRVFGGVWRVCVEGVAVAVCTPYRHATPHSTRTRHTAHAHAHAIQNTHTYPHAHAIQHTHSHAPVILMYTPRNKIHVLHNILQLCILLLRMAKIPFQCILDIFIPFISTDNSNLRLFSYTLLYTTKGWIYFVECTYNTHQTWINRQKCFNKKKIWCVLYTHHDCTVFVLFPDIHTFFNWVRVQ